jgi:hypothetical protein
MRPKILFGLAAAASCLFLTTGVRADMIPVKAKPIAQAVPSGSRNLIDADTRTADGSDTGDIDTVKAQAVPSGSQNFFDLGTPTADGSATGDINTATSFMFGDLFSGSANDGVFLGMPIQSFGSVSFNTGSPTSITFGNSVFGTFKSTSITNEGGAPGFVNIVALGEWTPGTQGGVTGGPFASEFRIGFTQTPNNTGIISAGGTFATPSVVPEPSTITMLLMGLSVGVASLRLRQRSSTKTPI